MPRQSKRTCPTCGKTFRYTSIRAHKPYPFCSAMCAARDLGVWMTEGYAIACEPDAHDVEELEALAEEMHNNEDDADEWR